MGLAISVGFLSELKQWDPEGIPHIQKDLNIINTHLKANHLPEHKEPESTLFLSSRADITSFPYGFIHYLRRVYARVIDDPDWIVTPTPEGENPANDPYLEEEGYMLMSHLVCHSDCEGYYLPVDFDDLIVDSAIPGGFIGSSCQLMTELCAIADPLGIELNDQTLSDDKVNAIKARIEKEEPLFRELMVWLALYEAARVSIACQSAIVFH